MKRALKKITAKTRAAKRNRITHAAESFSVIPTPNVLNEFHQGKATRVKQVWKRAIALFTEEDYVRLLKTYPGLAEAICSRYAVKRELDAILGQKSLDDEMKSHLSEDALARAILFEQRAMDKQHKIEMGLLKMLHFYVDFNIPLTIQYRQNMYTGPWFTKRVPITKIHKRYFTIERPELMAPLRAAGSLIRIKMDAATFENRTEVVNTSCTYRFRETTVKMFDPVTFLYLSSQFQREILSIITAFLLV